MVPMDQMVVMVSVVPTVQMAGMVIVKVLANGNPLTLEKMEVLVVRIRMGQMARTEVQQVISRFLLLLHSQPFLCLRADLGVKVAKAVLLTSEVKVVEEDAVALD